MKTLTKYYLIIALSLLSITATFAVSEISCETHANNYLFEKSGIVLNDVKNATINRCSDSLLITAKHDCLKNIKCFDNTAAAKLIFCSTHSKNRTFKAQSTTLVKSQTSVIKQCRSNPYTNQNECFDNLVCND